MIWMWFAFNEFIPVYFSHYSKITSIEQRRQYKKDFEKDFVEYKQLFNNRQRITKLFTDLEIQLRQVSNNEERHKVSQIFQPKYFATSFACYFKPIMTLMYTLRFDQIFILTALRYEWTFPVYIKKTQNHTFCS